MTAKNPQVSVSVGAASDVGMAGEAGTVRSQGVQQLVGVLVSATTLSGLTLYFGFISTQSFYSQMGIDTSLLGFSPQDYAIRSVGGAFYPIIVLTVLITIAVMIDLVISLVTTRPRSRRVAALMLILFIVGCAALADSVIYIQTRRTLLSVIDSSSAHSLVWVSGGALTIVICRHIGSILLLEDTVIDNIRVHITWAAICLAILAAFGAIIYITERAVTYGASDANRYLSGLAAGGKQVSAHSKQPLFSESESRRGLTTSASTSGYNYEYDGLRLVALSKEGYLLIDASDTSRVLLIPASSDIWLEFGG